MATFKVGQRVRKIGSARPEDYQRLLEEYPGPNVGGRRPPQGAEGTISRAYGDGSYDVLYDGHPSETGAWRSMGYTLAPLTDPKADAFLEKIRQLKPLDVLEAA